MLFAIIATSITTMPNLPEGSNIFQTVLDQLNRTCENCRKSKSEDNDNINASNKSSDISSSDILKVHSEITLDNGRWRLTCTTCGTELSANSTNNYISVERMRTRTITWADEVQNSPLVKEEQNSPRPVSRKNRKIAPKSILKQCRHENV